ncbi:MAG: hypothetical protein BMS9Abin36_0491 [Gammaproteobacteria bacterium]|nr:MAG: hypothetical protein BMS9Abin36_0491 [Gammaproteobacteria bacterium]
MSEPISLGGGNDPPATPRIQRIIAVMWPSFLVAGLANIFFFIAFDPEQLLQNTRFADVSRLGAYTVGFFLFWLLTSSSCMLTCYFQRPCNSQDRR